MEGIKFNVVEKKPCQTNFGIEVNAAVVRDGQEKAFIEIQKQVTIDGFRKGKAPMDVVKQKYNAHAQRHFLEGFIPKVINYVVGQEKIAHPYSSDIENLDFENENMKFNLILEHPVEFSVKDYKGVKIEKKSADVTDEDVDKFINNLRLQHSKLEASKSDTVSDNNYVLTDYILKPVDDPEKVENGKDVMFSLEQDLPIRGLSKNLIGFKIGETKDIDFTIPDDFYKEELRGKKVVVTVTVKEIKERVLPELNDDFAKNYKVDSLDKLKEESKKQLQVEKENKSKQDVERQLIDGLIEKNNIDVPKFLVEDRITRMIERENKYMAQYGLPPQYNDQAPEVRAKFEERAKKAVQIYFILNAIMEKENIQISDEEFESKIQETITSDPSHEKEIRKYFTENKDAIKTNMQEDKLFKFLLDNAKMK